MSEINIGSQPNSPEVITLRTSNVVHMNKFELTAERFALRRQNLEYELEHGKISQNDYDTRIAKISKMEDRLAQVQNGSSSENLEDIEAENVVVQDDANWYQDSVTHYTAELQAGRISAEDFAKAISNLSLLEEKRRLQEAGQESSHIVIENYSSEEKKGYENSQALMVYSNRIIEGLGWKLDSSLAQEYTADSYNSTSKPTVKSDFEQNLRFKLGYEIVQTLLEPAKQGQVFDDYLQQNFDINKVPKDVKTILQILYTKFQDFYLKQEFTDTLPLQMELLKTLENITGTNQVVNIPPDSKIYNMRKSNYDEEALSA